MSRTPIQPHGDGAHYRITVAGHVGEGWRRWFDADAVRPGPDTTEIVVRVADQAELLGRLRRVRDLNLRLVAVDLLAPSNPDSTDAPSSAQGPASHSDT